MTCNDCQAADGSACHQHCRSWLLTNEQIDGLNDGTIVHSFIDITNDSDYILIDEIGEEEIDKAFAHLFEEVMSNIIRNNPDRGPSFYLNESIRHLHSLSDKIQPL